MSPGSPNISRAFAMPSLPTCNATLIACMGLEPHMRAASQILIATRVTLSYNPNATAACGGRERECDEATAALQQEADELQARCERLAKKTVRGGSASRRVEACLAELNSLDANLTAQAQRCATLPAPCGGRGNCTEGVCVCDPSWYGPQCETQPSCR